MDRNIFFFVHPHAQAHIQNKIYSPNYDLHTNIHTHARSPNFNANDQIRVKGIECLCVQHTLISEHSVWFWRATRGRGRGR